MTSTTTLEVKEEKWEEKSSLPLLRPASAGEEEVCVGKMTTPLEDHHQWWSSSKRMMALAYAERGGMTQDRPPHACRWRVEEGYEGEWCCPLHFHHFHALHVLHSTAP